MESEPAQEDLFRLFGLTPQRAGSARLVVGDCLEVIPELVAEGGRFGAVVTDPPYEIDLHGKTWDGTGIAFSPDLWRALTDALLPGGWVLAFCAARRYHRVAVAAEDAGLVIHPPLTWAFGGGLPKPANLSELFDRENKEARPVLGRSGGSGMTKANVQFGAQNRSATGFVRKARGTTEESRQWRGYYYGMNCFAPRHEPILLAQKPPDGRMVDNIREHGVGALNLGRWREDQGAWPTTEVEEAKASAREKEAAGATEHPSVKPIRLMRRLLRLLPPGTRVLDPFAGTGTTGAAALDEGHECVLVEKNPDYAEAIAKRLG